MCPKIINHHKYVYRAVAYNHLVVPSQVASLATAHRVEEARGHEALCCCQVERSKLSPEWLNWLLNENDKH